METLDRTMLHAIGEETKPAIIRYDMWHGRETPLAQFF
jgi:hypothetical protein